MTPRRDTRLTDPVKRLLALLHAEGQVVERAGSWSGTNIKFHSGTIEAAYDRCLISITTDSRHRKMHIAKLTEIGMHVARDLVRQHIQRDLYHGEKPVISEEARKLIVELVNAA